MVKHFLYKSFAPFASNTTLLPETYLQPLVEAARSHCYVENVGNKADSLHRRIEQTYEEQICDAYVATLKPQIKKRHLGSVMLAFDFTDEDFYGYTSDMWLHPWTGEQGVQATYTFGVLSLVGKQKIPLMAVPVHCGMSKETIFSLFLAIAKKLRLHVRCILLDAGFYSEEVIEALQSYKYLIRAPLNEKIKKLVVATELWDIYHDTIRKTKTQIVIVKHVRFKNTFVDCSYATNMQFSDGMSYVHLYCRRWQIETNFRMEDQVRIKSKSRSILVRYFYFMISMLLHAVWLMTWSHKMAFDTFKVHLANQLLFAAEGIEYLRPII